MRKRHYNKLAKDWRQIWEKSGAPMNGREWDLYCKMVHAFCVTAVEDNERFHPGIFKTATGVIRT